MRYEPTEWKAGDIVTSQKLNKLEQGIATNILVVSLIYDDENYETWHLDKTWQEIYNSTISLIKSDFETSDQRSSYFSFVNGIYTIIEPNNIQYKISFYDGYNTLEAIATGPNEYPVGSQN